MSTAATSEPWFSKTTEFTQWLRLRYVDKQPEVLEAEVLIAELNLFRSTYAPLFDSTYTSKPNKFETSQAAKFSKQSENLLHHNKQKLVSDLIIRYRQSVPSHSDATGNTLREAIITSGKTIGLFSNTDFTLISAELLEIVQEIVRVPEKITHTQLIDMIEERDSLRARKEYGHADYVLSLLSLHGFEINDSLTAETAPINTRWRFSV